MTQNIRKEQNEDVVFICAVRCGAVWSRFSQISFQHKSAVIALRNN
ncbi:hypothetical protein SeKB_A1682 [Salmonella enterica subsp. enterica serovar Kentucky str. CDC 191]|nr:hypothetical protein SeKB_A1682 [Salmonella enterica subsp. enterica serovar Kentucky str. CDC 191]